MNTSRHLLQLGFAFAIVAIVATSWLYHDFRVSFPFPGNKPFGFGFPGPDAALVAGIILGWMFFKHYGLSFLRSLMAFVVTLAGVGAGWLWLQYGPQTYQWAEVVLFGMLLWLCLGAGFLTGSVLHSFKSRADGTLTTKDLRF